MQQVWPFVRTNSLTWKTWQSFHGHFLLQRPLIVQMWMEKFLFHLMMKWMNYNWISTLFLFVISFFVDTAKFWTNGLQHGDRANSIIWGEPEVTLVGSAQPDLTRPTHCKEKLHRESVFINPQRVVFSTHLKNTQPGYCKHFTYQNSRNCHFENISIYSLPCNTAILQHWN